MMIKSLLKNLHLALLASALVFAPGVHAKPSPSFKSGFSSQRSSPAPSKPKFGSFGASGSTASAPASDAAGAKRGGFGSFGSAPAQDARKSDSALSQRLDKNASEAKALRTLDERKAAKEEQARDTRPVPGYESRQHDAAPASQPNMQAPIIVQQGGGSGIGNVVAGYVLGRMANGSHAGTQQYPGNVTSTASVGQPASSTGFFGGVLRMFLWLAILSAIVWLAYFVFQRMRRNREANKPHYSFERN